MHGLLTDGFVAFVGRVAVAVFVARAGCGPNPALPDAMTSLVGRIAVVAHAAVTAERDNAPTIPSGDSHFLLIFDWPIAATVANAAYERSASQIADL